MPRSRYLHAVKAESPLPGRTVRNRGPAALQETNAPPRNLRDPVDLVKIKGAVLGFPPDNPLRILVMALPDQLPRMELNALIPAFIRLLSMTQKS